MGSSKTYCSLSILCLIFHTGGKVPKILDRWQFSKFWSPPVFCPFLNFSPVKYLQEQFPTLLLRWCRPWYFIPAPCYWCPPSPRHLATLASCVFWKCGVVQLQLNWYHLSGGKFVAATSHQSFSQLRCGNTMHTDQHQHRGTEWPAIFEKIAFSWYRFILSPCLMTTCY